MRRILVAVLVTLALASCSEQNAYRVATAQQSAEVVSAVRDDYAVRNQLTAGLAIEAFWRTYPELSYAHELMRGINLDVMLWTWSRDPQLRRLN